LRVCGGRRNEGDISTDMPAKSELEDSDMDNPVDL
jgi:hypothetical protein